MVAFGVRHRRLQQLAPIAGGLAGGEGEDSASLCTVLPRRCPGHHPGLASRGPHVAGVGPHDAGAAPAWRAAERAFLRPLGRPLSRRRAPRRRRALSRSRLLGGGCPAARRPPARCGGASGLLAPRRRGLRLVGSGLLRLRGRLPRQPALWRQPAFSRGRRFCEPRGSGVSSAAPAPPRPLIAPSAEPACPRNTRVGANSPSLWPTIDSLMNTGTCFLPSCTAIVWPTISGKIVDARDQVRSIFLLFSAFNASMRASSRSCTHGPFLLERLIAACPSRAGGRARCTCPSPCSACACDTRASARPTA